MRRLATTLTLAAAFLALPAAMAYGDPSEYGIESVSATASTNQAGAHPDLTFGFTLKTEPSGELPATSRDITIGLPPGLLANPDAVPKCSAEQLSTIDVSDKSNETGCPQDSQVGIAAVELFKQEVKISIYEPVYNMDSPGGDTAARLGFVADSFPVFIDAHLRPDDYGVTATVSGASSLLPLLSAETTLWGVPAAESHDAQRITPYEATSCNGSPCTAPGGQKRPSGLVPVPFTANPTRCGIPREVEFTATSYVLPDQPTRKSASMPPVTGCGQLDFSPEMSFSPTTKSADSSSGMEVKLSLPQAGFKYPNLPVEAHLKRAAVTLPRGLFLNPAAASGLSACSEAEIGLKSENPIRFDFDDPTCPESSRVGTVEIKTPVLPEPIEGSLYLARQGENPFHTLLSGYLVAEGQGVTIKLAGRFDIDPQTHQLTGVFDENPQAPFETLTLRFKEGARGVLITPPSCGSYGIESHLSPWSAGDPFEPTPAEIVSSTSTFTIDSGPEGGPCPTGRFDPSLEAGTATPFAGQFSPFMLRVVRKDGTQRLKSIDVSLPPGLTGRLAGIPYCPEAAIKAAEALSDAGQGAQELASPSCPVASLVGRAIAGAGAGPTPFYLETGKAYLAGPYRGAPFSLVVIAPAVAGPLDLGDTVVRSALYVNPETARVTAVSDPLPSVLGGIPLDIRDIRVVADRPDFMLNPTRCREMAFAGQAVSEGGVVAPLSERFQVGGCRGLDFKPKISLRLRGKTNRGGHPSLRATVVPRAGDANIARVQALLPHSEFLDQAHIRTICTRVQFAADRCPPGSVYGHARAFTPLLDHPLEGPVYLRSSRHELPDLVVSLSGQIDFDLVGRIDSIKGGIRTTFEAAPDAPVSKFVLLMQGGKKGLLVNSRDLCDAPARAQVKFVGQNGKTVGRHPLLQDGCATSPRRSQKAP